VSLLQSMWMFLLSLTIILEIFSFIFLKLYPKIFKNGCWKDYTKSLI